MDAWEKVGVIAEVIGWAGLGVGLLCLGLALLIRIADGRWLPTDAVIADAVDESGAGGRVVRWFAAGEFHARPLSAAEWHHVGDVDAEQAFYREREPQHLRLHEPPAGRRILRLLGLVFLGLAVVAGAIGVVLMFVG